MKVFIRSLFWIVFISTIFTAISIYYAIWHIDEEVVQKVVYQRTPALENEFKEELYDFTEEFNLFAAINSRNDYMIFFDTKDSIKIKIFCIKNGFRVEKWENFKESEKMELSEFSYLSLFEESVIFEKNGRPKIRLNIIQFKRKLNSYKKLLKNIGSEDFFEPEDFLDI